MKMYDILSTVEKQKDGALWAGLSSEEQEELVLIEKESQSPENLIANDSMKAKHKKWL